MPLVLPTKFKATQIVLSVLFLFTLVNILLALYSTDRSTANNNNHGDNSGSYYGYSKEGVSAIFGKLSSLTLPTLSLLLLSLQKKGQDYKVVGYHHNEDNDFVVFQKDYLSNEHLATDTTHHFWNFVNSDLDSRQNYDIKLINGYNYKDYISKLNQEHSLMLNSSFSDHYDMEMKFTTAFIEFFNTILKTIEDCKPNINRINDDEHYPNAAKLEKYYQTLNKLTDDQMNGFKFKLELIHKNGRMPVYGGHLRENYQQELIRNKELLSMYITLNDMEMEALKNSHQVFINSMMKDWPEDLTKYNKYNDFLKGDGIVYLAGGKYNQLALLSIKVLRENGSRLPVEVIIPKHEDYDEQFCNRILPNLNGKCKLMSDYIPKSYYERVIKNGGNAAGYQMKNVAIFISSFERVLYLDADNIPIKNPDILFVNKPFTNNHLVIWPDLWRRSTSPKFYEIAGIKVDPAKKLRNSYTKGDPRGVFQSADYETSIAHNSYHDCQGAIPEPSSETGQLLINKKVHFKTLLLSMYYNTYGPDYYYPLLSQGAAGEGDKETFIAAAHKLNLPYYQVQEFNREFGPKDGTTNKHLYFAMGQYDPIIDYIQSNNDTEYVNNKAAATKQKQKQEDKLEEDPEDNPYLSTPPTQFASHEKDNSKYNYDYHLYKSSSLFFLHANWPKYFFQQLFTTDERGPVDNKGNRRRLYGNELRLELSSGSISGYDFELKVIEQLQMLFCTAPKFDLGGVPDAESNERREVCDKVEEQRLFLKIS